MSLQKAKDRELNTFVKYSVAEAASRQGISPSALMKMRWVVTLKDDGTHPVDRVRYSWNLLRHLVFRLTKRDVRCAFLTGDLDVQHVDDNGDGENLNVGLAQPVSVTFCEPVPKLSRKLQLEHHQRVRFLKAVYGLVNTLRRWYHPVATDLRNTAGVESLMEPCLWTLRN